MSLECARVPLNKSFSNSCTLSFLSNYSIEALGISSALNLCFLFIFDLSAITQDIDPISGVGS